MRTQEEIVAKIKEDTSLFHFYAEALFPFLEYTYAMQVVDPQLGLQAEEHQAQYVALSEENVLGALTSYMNFAWGKVENHRGISAGRSVEKCSAYVWLLGNDDLLAAVATAEYAQYGAPKLAIICRSYNLPIPDDEDTQRMIHGEPCGASPTCGCA